MLWRVKHNCRGAELASLSRSDGVRPSSMWAFKQTGEAAVVVSLLFVLSACGFHPLFAEGPSGSMHATLATIAVDPVSDTSVANQEQQADPLKQSDKVLSGKPHESRLGQLLQDGLVRYMGEPTAPRYHLKITINQSVEAFGIRQDESFTRLRLGLQAHYTLLDARTDKAVTTGDAFSDLGIDRVASEYATLVAETAGNQRNAQQLVETIIAKLSLYIHDHPTHSDQ